MADLKYTVERLGQTKEPLVIIDNFFSDPDALIEFAKQKKFEKRGAFYPGVRCVGNVNYLAERMALLTAVLKEVFGVKQGVKVVECNYSLVTTRPENLMPIQCLPHFDGLDVGRFALLHYLSRSETGGTAFYRHRRTGFETVTEDRFEIYKAVLEKEATNLGLPPRRYFNESSDQFVQTFKVDPKLNRLIIYRSITLHSGLIPQNSNFSQNPELGRLTLNTFFQEKFPDSQLINNSLSDPKGKSCI